MELRQEQLAKQAQIDRMNQRYVASINVHDKELLSDVHTVMHVAHGLMDHVEHMQQMEERFKAVYALAMENDASLAEALYMAAGTAAADYVGVTSLYEAKIGEDLLTGRKLSSGERWFRGITGGISLVTTAMGIGSGLSTIGRAARGPCGGMIFRRCFVGDTQVVIGENDLGETVAYAGLSADNFKQAALAVGGVALAVGVGGAALKERERRKKKAEQQKRRRDAGLDNLFGNSKALDEAMNTTVFSAADHCPDELIDEDLMDILTNDSLSVPISHWDTSEVQPELTPAVVKPETTSEYDSPKQSMRSIVQRPIAWLALWLTVAAGCCWYGLREGETTGNFPTNAVAAVEKPKYETKAIQDIREGDIVMARNEFGNDLGMKRVVEVYRRTSNHLRILTFQAPDGSSQTLKTTDEHPFWIDSSKTFLAAGNMRIGDTVTGPYGEIQTVAFTIYEPHPEGVPVYNFQVEDYHTYFVSENGARAPPVLVHNANYSVQSRTHVFTHGHAANSPRIAGKSRFRPTEGGQKFTDEVLNHPNVRVTHQGNGRIRYDVDDLGRTTGRDHSGNITRGGRVIVEGPSPQPWSTYLRDEVVTQFPL